MPDCLLADTLNRYFAAGCKTFTRHELLAYGGGDRRRVENSLHFWESEGLLEIRTPLELASDSEIVVRVFEQIPQLDMVTGPLRREL
jgi:hypothetical protein